MLYITHTHISGAGRGQAHRVDPGRRPQGHAHHHRRRPRPGRIYYIYILYKLYIIYIYYINYIFI